MSDYLNNVKKNAQFVLRNVRAPSTAGLGGAKTSTTKPPPAELEDEDNIWGGLDPSKCDLSKMIEIISFSTSYRTLLIHGLETDWIEEEMADDDDFRQD